MSFICGIVEGTGKMPSFEVLRAMGGAVSRGEGEEVTAFLDDGIGIISSSVGKPIYLWGQGGHTYAVASVGDLPEEILLDGYFLYGDELHRHIDGSFSLFIYDRDCSRALLIRSDIDAPPFYYHRQGSRLCFATHETAFREDPKKLGAGECLALPV